MISPTLVNTYKIISFPVRILEYLVTIRARQSNYKPYSRITPKMITDWPRPRVPHSQSGTKSYG